MRLTGLVDWTWVFYWILTCISASFGEAEEAPVIEVQYEPLESKSAPHVRVRRAVTALKERLWDNGVIPYVINENVTVFVEMNIMAAIQHWEKHTCIKFAERVNETDYIEFAPGQCGCCSFVGRQGKGRQFVNLTPYCAVYGVAVHELGHTIGFWHEHSRPDRDKYVRIQRENIKADRMENFQMKSAMDIDSLGQPYDYRSIMHYRRTTFSSNEKDTMVPLQEDVVIGQREALSPGDILQANLLYNCPKPRCDEIYVENTGNITSPNHPMHYYKDHNCTWIINCAPESVVKITFDAFEVEPTDNCTFDYLEIRQGGAEGTLIGRLCGIGLPGELLVKGPVWLNFVSDVSVTMGGFNGYYEIVSPSDQPQHDEFATEADNAVTSDQNTGAEQQAAFDNGIFSYKTDCHKKFGGVMGTVASPLSLAMSGTEFDCTWTVVGERGMKAKSIQISLDTRITRLHEPKCFGELFGGFSPYEYDCTNLTKSSFMLKTNKVMISWSSRRHTAFRFDYLIDYDECSTNVSQCEQICINKVEGYECRCRPGYLLEHNGYTCRPKLAQYTDLCNSKLTSARGVITALHSASLPHDCYFEIQQPMGHRIHLVFSEMNVPETDNCTRDYVEVSKGANEQDSLYCGSGIPSPISTSNGYLKLTLHVERGAVPVQGKPYFVANFVAHPNPDGERCFYRLRTRGNLTSPNFPQKYPHRSACIYKISVHPPYKVKLTFSALDIEVTKRCMFDHVIVRNGRNRASPLIGRFCGRKVPQDIISRGRHLWIMFISDENHNGRGFSASFTTVQADGAPVVTTEPPTTPPTTMIPALSTESATTRRRRRRKRRHTRIPTTTAETAIDDHSVQTQNVS